MLILASGSPRRKELLSLITPDFRVIPSGCEEKADKSLSPSELVKELALQKAQDVYETHKNDVVIGADTVVAIENEILGKPRDGDDAFRMLKTLSGREHFVFTGVCVVNAEKTAVFAEQTAVRFFELSDSEINDYILTGEPFDKAGAYGIQDKGALLVSGIDGDYYNVMGLPVGKLSRVLKELHILY